jgi:hypothetical protein
LNSVNSLPLASEKSGRAKSGIDGIETDGIEGIAGIMSRADLVMLSIRLGARPDRHRDRAFIAG